MGQRQRRGARGRGRRHEQQRDPLRHRHPGAAGDPFVLGEPAESLNAELAPDGRFTVLGTSDGVETWDLVPDHWRDDACRLAGRNLTQDEWDAYLANAGPYQRTCEEWPADR